MAPAHPQLRVRPRRAPPRPGRGKMHPKDRYPPCPSPSPRLARRYPAPLGRVSRQRGSGEGGGMGGVAGHTHPRHPETLRRAAGPRSAPAVGGPAPLQRSPRQRPGPPREGSAGRLLRDFQRFSAASPPDTTTSPRLPLQNLTLQTENKAVRHRGARPGRRSGERKQLITRFGYRWGGDEIRFFFFFNAFFFFFSTPLRNGPASRSNDHVTRK